MSPLIPLEATLLTTLPTPPMYQTGLMDTLNEQNKLFQDVRMTREAAQDSELLSRLSLIAAKQAQKLTTRFTDFDPVTFTQKAKTLMGGRVEGNVRKGLI